MECQLQPSPAPGVGGQGVGVVPNLPGGHRAFEDAHIPRSLGGVKFPAHGPDVRNGPANGIRGGGEGKVVPGFQEHTFRLHQPLAHRPVGGLAEVPALGVL